MLAVGAFPLLFVLVSVLPVFEPGANDMPLAGELWSAGRQSRDIAGPLLYRYCFVNVWGFFAVVFSSTVLLSAGWGCLRSAAAGASTREYWIPVIALVVLDFFLGVRWYSPRFIWHSMLASPPGELLWIAARNVALCALVTVLLIVSVRPWRFMPRHGSRFGLLSATIGLILANHMLASAIFVWWGPTGVQ